LELAKVPAIVFEVEWQLKVDSKGDQDSTKFFEMKAI
jgi:hypothetical protein